MEENITQPAPASFDVVGNYNQNAINGFSPDLISKMIEHAHIFENCTVMDAMGGDGNLTLDIFEYCKQKGTPLPEVTVYEHSQVQAGIAREKLKGYPAEVHTGDILTLNKQSDIPNNHFNNCFLL